MKYYIVFISIIIQWLFIFNIPQYSLVLKPHLRDELTDKDKRFEKLQDLFNKYNVQYKDSFHLGYKYAVTALSLSKELNDTQHEISALIYIASYYNTLGNLNQAEHYLNNALNLNGRYNNPYFRAKIYLNKGSVYLKKGTADSSLFYINKGLGFAYLINNKELTGYGHRLAGYGYNLKGEKLKALENFDKATEYYAGDKAALASIYSSKGLIYSDAGKIELATKFYNMALKIREEMNQYDMMGYLYSNLAGIYGTHLDLKKSIEYNILALSLFERIKDKKGEGYVLNNLGQTYFSMNRFDKALDYFKKSLFFRNQLTDKQALAFTLTNIGETYLRKNLPDSSIVFLKKSLQISNEINDKLLNSVVFNSLGKFYRSQKNYEAAIRYLNKSIYFTKQIEYLQQLEDCYFQLSEIYKELNQSRKALAYLQLRNRIHDSIYSANAQAYIANAQVKYETERLEKNENISRKLKVNRIITWSVISLLFILICGIVYYYKNKILPKLKIAGILSSSNIKSIREDKRKLKTVKKELLPEREEKYKKNVDSEILDSISEKFTQLLEKEKVFLSEEISQSEIAKRLNTNTAYLSKLINEKYQTNFSSLINSFRVEEAKRLIRENAQDLLTFEGISSESGFHSKSSFNAAFKKFTGLTPTEFAKTLPSTKELEN
ncbi:MAG: tetratricopeptide repeat protein [Bacteroidota bacterium]|nr:tetratricopeptide repeat protein [Bacteroidota bacterium]MDP4195215.1 tetratricopeptide repeat protein [Bacteroidota bacterium]